jgi:hypothetical protein
MNAKPSEAIPVLSEHVLEGQLVIETECNDFDHYKRLPGALTFKGITLVKTGWSSDTGKACFKQSTMIAYRVNV